MHNVSIEHILWSGHSIICTKINGSAMTGGRIMTIDQADDVHIWEKTPLGWSLIWKGPVADLAGFTRMVGQIGAKTLGENRELYKAWQT